MSRPLQAALLAASVAFAAVPVAVSGHPAAIRLEHAWIRPTPPGAPTAAGYVTITNTGAAPDRLLGGSMPGVDRVEVHQMSMAGGIMRMRPVAGGLPIAPGQTVALAPGGYHLMLIGLKRPFTAGERVRAVLRFAQAGDVMKTFDVGAGPAPSGAPGHMDMSHMDMH